MGLFEALGLDIRILLAQLINFAVLIFILYRFLYTPLLNLMEDRKKRIAEGVKRAEEAEELQVKATKDAEVIILTAKREAKKIIEQAHQSAKEAQEMLTAKAKKEAENIITIAKKQSNDERQGYVKRLQGEIAQLVVLASEKLVEKHWDTGEDEEFIKRTINRISAKG